MPVFDLRFPDDVRRTIADLAAKIAEAGPAAVLSKIGVPEDADADFADIWLSALHERIEGDTVAAVKLLADARFGDEAVTLSEGEAFAALRGFTTLRLSLRETALSAIADDALETGRIDRRRLTAAQRHALACYGVFGEIQAALCEMPEW